MAESKDKPQNLPKTTEKQAYHNHNQDATGYWEDTERRIEALEKKAP
ncbi:hypothetical protein GTB64_004474 [Salmonella enterica]|nr:hypothetical protein [Salmonella enterica]